jgi:hypothetical protein
MGTRHKAIWGAVFLVLLTLAASWRPSKPKHVTVSSTASLPPADQARLDAQLWLLRSQGYKLSPSSQVFQVTPKRSWWSKLWTLHADTFYNSDGYTSLTGIDTGDPSTGAMWVYATAGTAAVWGGVAWDQNGDVTNTWSEGGVAERATAPLGDWAAKLCPILSANLESFQCGGGVATTASILRDAVSSGIFAAGGSAMGGCATYWCLGASFYGTFNITLWSDVYNLWNACTYAPDYWWWW